MSEITLFCPIHAAPGRQVPGESVHVALPAEVAGPQLDAGNILQCLGQPPGTGANGHHTRACTGQRFADRGAGGGGGSGHQDLQSLQSGSIPCSGCAHGVLLPVIPAVDSMTGAIFFDSAS